MARKINNTYNHYCNYRRYTIPSLSTDSTLYIVYLLIFSEIEFYIRSIEITADILFFASDIIKEKKPLASIILDKIKFRIFKEVLHKDSIYNSSTNRILYYISKNDIKVNYTHKFKAATLYIYNSSKNPILFHIKARL